MNDVWEVYALKYAERLERTRSESFVFDPADDHLSPHPMDYFVWVLRNGSETIVVDTGYDAGEGARRGRPILADPVEVLRDFGVEADTVKTVIVTHLHYDHAGTLDRFPHAKFHLQAAEMAYATGPCMCHDALQMPFTVAHVCEMVRHVYSGRVVFYDGDAEVAPGVEVAAIGGHSRGLQAVRVKTTAGWLVLASDASHYYENFLTHTLFPIVVDAEDMLAGFGRLETLATERSLIVPGHDPLVRQIFPHVAGPRDGASIHRLDAPLVRQPVEVLGKLW